MRRSFGKRRRIDQTDIDRGSLLNAAAVCGDKSLEMINFLLEKGLNLPAACPDGNEVLTHGLFAALDWGNEAAALLLLDKGAKIDSFHRDNYRRRPLHIAAFRGYLPLVKRLCKDGAQVNARDSNGTTPLHEATTIKENY